MPFTFSHPALVLPLTKYTGRYLSLTGLIVGSITPDFEYFSRTSFQTLYSHETSGLFFFDLPFGAALCFVFHLLVRNSLYDHLPDVFRSRLISFKTFDWTGYFRQNYGAVIYSILIGGASHIFWDGFTHKHRYFVEFIPVLQYRFLLFGHKMPAYGMLQVLSSVIGGAIVAAAFFRLPTYPVPKTPPRRGYWQTVLAVCALIMALRLVFLPYGHFKKALKATALSAFLIGLVVAPVIMKRVRTKLMDRLPSKID